MPSGQRQWKLRMCVRRDGVPGSVFIMVIGKHLEFMMRPWGCGEGIRNPAFADFSVKQSSCKVALHLSAGSPAYYRLTLF